MDENEMLNALFGKDIRKLYEEAKGSADDGAKAQMMSAVALESIAESLKRIVVILESK